MTERTKRLSRRDFLLSAGAGAAAAAAIVAKAADSESPKKGEGKRATRGYHASGHIDNYYRTTKV